MHRSWKTEKSGYARCTTPWSLGVFENLRVEPGDPGLVVVDGARGDKILGQLFRVEAGNLDRVEAFEELVLLEARVDGDSGAEVDIANFGVTNFG